MKVEDFLKWEHFDLYETPIVGPDQTLTPAITNFYDQFKFTGKTIERLELWAFKSGDDRAFALVNNNTFYTILVGKVIHGFPGETRKETIIISQTETPEEFKGNGYSPALIDGLVKFGYRVISDSMLSKNAFSVWNKLLSKRTADIKYWDMAKNRYTDESPSGKENIRFILEHNTFKHTSAILEDRTFWTELYK